MILNQDCRSVDWSATDVMIVDPPYSAHVHASAVSQDQHAVGNVRHNDFGFSSRSNDLMVFLCSLAAKVRRWSCIYTDIESVGSWRDGLRNAGAQYIRAIPWVRWSMPQLSGDRPPQGAEMVVVAYGAGKGKKHWNGPGNLTHLSHLCLRGAGKHKTEKPLDQLLDLVSWFSDFGELVIDPCSGSGTTGLSSLLLGRRFLGAELDAAWFFSSSLRLKSPLSERDYARKERWLAAHRTMLAEKDRMAETTKNVRARLEARKETTT